MALRSGILRHMLLWLLYIGFEIEYLHITAGTLSSFTHFFIYYMLNIGLFYFNASVTLNFAFFRASKPYMIAFLLIILEIAGYLAIKVILDAFFTGRSLSQVLHWGQPYLMANLWRGIYFIGLSTAYFSTLYMIRFKEKTHRAETERLRSVAAQLELENRLISVENAYLQNQISPHLLFNTLNFIYNAVEEHSERAGKGVKYLAEIMRYSLVSSIDKQEVALADEIRQIGNLVALSRLRFGDDLYLNFRVSGSPGGLEVMPLVFVTLAENMLKHGDLGDPSFPATLHLEIFSQSLCFLAVNRKRTTATYLSTGIGLVNLEKRLANYYPDRYKLEIKDLDDTFNVKLTIKL